MRSFENYCHKISCKHNLILGRAIFCIKTIDYIHQHYWWWGLNKFNSIAQHLSTLKLSFSDLLSSFLLIEFMQFLKMKSKQIFFTPARQVYLPFCLYTEYIAIHKFIFFVLNKNNAILIFLNWNWCMLKVYLYKTFKSIF